MPGEIEKTFVSAIIRFLRGEIEKMNEESAESLEVAIQCLETAYELPSRRERPEDGEEGAHALRREPPNPLSRIDLFQLFETTAIHVSGDRREQAEEIKNVGNRLMTEGKYNEALSNYNRAISLDATNPVFYCNRAAAYIRLNEFNRAISDCRMSLLYNPNYGKAYGRMGIAYSNLLQYEQARQAYRRALEIEPNNQDYRNNLRLCEERLQQTPSRFGDQLIQNLPMEGRDLQNLLGEMLNDPMMSVARQLVMQVASNYPDFMNGLQQQLANLAAPPGDVEGGQRQPGQQAQQDQNAGQQAQQQQNRGQQGQQEQVAPQRQQEGQEQGHADGGDAGTAAGPPNLMSGGRINLNDDMNVIVQELNRIRESDLYASQVERRIPLHQRTPRPPRTPEELAEMEAIAAGAAPRLENAPPGEGANMHNAPVPPPQPPRPDGGGDFGQQIPPPPSPPM